MPSEKPARRLEDIVENARAIQRYVAGMNLCTACEDALRRMREGQTSQ